MEKLLRGYDSNSNSWTNTLVSQVNRAADRGETTFAVTGPGGGFVASSTSLEGLSREAETHCGDLIWNAFKQFVAESGPAETAGPNSVFTTPASGIGFPTGPFPADSAPDLGATYHQAAKFAGYIGHLGEVIGMGGNVLMFKAVVENINYYVKHRRSDDPGRKKQARKNLLEGFADLPRRMLFLGNPYAEKKSAQFSCFSPEQPISGSFFWVPARFNLKTLNQPGGPKKEVVAQGKYRQSLRSICLTGINLGR